MNSQGKAQNEYHRRNYDQKRVLLPKGSLEQLAALASAEGVSVNRYILEALEARSGLKLVLDNDLPWMKKE